MKNEKIKAFGAESSFAEADLILIPARWEATVSYGEGTAEGPELIRKASAQLDFFNRALNRAYNHKIHFEPEDSFIPSLNKKARAFAKAVQKNFEEGKALGGEELALCEKANQASQSLLDWIYKKSARVCESGKIPALVGGEHSVSEGLVRLIGERLKGEYGLLHIDAHADLRESYQGFKHSHASVMRNILNLPFPPKTLVQAGARDICEEERRLIKEDTRIHCYFDEDISARLFNREKCADICREAIKLLPPQVYVSLDVDGLSWSYAPGTGAPVPGGFSFNRLLYLFSEIKRQNKRLIAFDVVETSGGGLPARLAEWNGNVSARLIYCLAGLALSSKGLI